jgi:NAD(P)H-dependent flavin oxidoreductase YrpB (nitropropane dioxygenase family)
MRTSYMQIYLRACMAIILHLLLRLPLDPSKMNFGSGGESESKAWKDIWGCGQGIGAVEAVLPAADFVDRLAEEYATAKSRLRALTA